MILAKNTKHEKKKNLRLASVSFLVVIYIKRNLFGLRSDVTNGKKVKKKYIKLDGMRYSLRVATTFPRRRKNGGREGPVFPSS